MQQQKVARWLREIKHTPPADAADRPHVVQHLFKVSPPIEFTTSETYRRGKLLHSVHWHFPRRIRHDRRLGRKLEGSEMFKVKKDPIYSYRDVRRTTAFVIASASDLATFMNAANARMQEVMRKKDDQEGVQLFQRRDHFEVETYLFPCHKNGAWKDSGELEGSQRGTLDHRMPLRDIGYLVIGMPVNLEIVASDAEWEHTPDEGEDLDLVAPLEVPRE